MSFNLIDLIVVGICLILAAMIIMILTGTHKKLGGLVMHWRRPRNKYPDDKPQAYYSNRR